MAIEKVDIDYVANLARIELSAEEKETLTTQLETILGHFEKIKAVDVTGVEPMAHAFPLNNVLQADETKPGLSPEEAVSNAPQKRENQVVVPKVVEDAGSA